MPVLPPPVISAPRPPAAADNARGRAPSPPAVSGRTIGLAQGPQAVATLGPRLAVDGPDVVAMKIGGRDLLRTLVIRNVGQGKMPGRVSSDRPWLKVPQARLDPMAAEQSVTVTVAAKEIPWGRTAGTVTVATDHGERRTLTLQVSRTSIVPYLAGFAALAAVAFVVAAAGFVWMQQQSASRALLILAVDPVADRVFVDGTNVGSGARLEIAEPKPGAPFLLRVEADGFEPREEIVTLREGEHTTRTVLLTLDDDMRWAPASDDEGVPPDPALVAALPLVTGALTPCFAEAGVPTAEALYTAWITPNGQVRRVDIASANFSVEPAQACIQRVFRGVRLPPFAGDYATVETRLAVTVTP